MASDIQVYGTKWCGVTYGVRRYLMASHFEYDYVDIDDDKAANEFVLTANQGLRRFPIVVVEECVLTGPTIAELGRVLGQHGIHPTRLPGPSSSGTGAGHEHRPAQ